MKTLLLFTFLSALPIFAAEPKTADAVKAADKLWASASVNADKVALTKVLASDVVYTHATGDKDTRDSFIANLTNGNRKYTKINHDEMNVRMFGNTAILDADLQIETVQNGTAAPAHLHIIHVYIYKEGRWQIVAHQSLRYAK